MDSLNLAYGVFLWGFGLNLANALLQCKDFAGNDVDWFIVYKLPKILQSSHPLVQKGLGHLYLDVNQPSWQLSQVSLNDSHQAVAYTLNQIYKNFKAKDVAYAMYNDEAPPKTLSMSHGHTKGDIAFDVTSGFWLVHSLPRFPPPANESYAYPPSGLHYGQTFLCLSLHYKAFNSVGLQFKYNYPQIYDFNLPEPFVADNPDLADVLFHKSHVQEAPWKNRIELTSLQGEKFSSFAKFRDFDADLYSAWLAPFYQSDLNVESWQNGRGKLPSNCTGEFKVYNVEVLSPSVLDVSFKETKDHSKWAVTQNASVMCIGDINRAEEQEKRAGGTVCFDIPSVWTSFQKAIKLVEPCPA